MRIEACKCGSCPVLVETKEGSFRAGCSNEDCQYYGLFTLTDYEKEFVLQQWNALCFSRAEDLEE